VADQASATPAELWGGRVTEGRGSTLSKLRSSVGLPLLGVVLAIALWWSIAVIFDIDPFYLPAPPDVLDAFTRLGSTLLHDTWITLYEVLVGYGIAVVGGLVLAVVLAAFRAVDRMTMPLIAAFNAVPKVALAPMLLVWIGFGTPPKIVMVVLVSFFPILVSTIAGLRSTPADLRELASSLSASWWQTFRRVRLPWALPQIFVGLKVGISLAIIGACIGEVIQPERGLGSVVATAPQAADTPLVFVGLTLLAIMGGVLFYLVVWLERLVVPWAKSIST
jgi:NitT/TauT family transport system permease protein